MISTTIRNSLIQAVFATLGIAAIAFSSNSYALGLTSSTSTSFFKSLATGKDLICKAKDGQVNVTANTDGGMVHFIMESAKDDDTGLPIPQTCYEVDHDNPPTFAECENER